MEHYRKTSHSTYDIKYHIVWITKYRKQIMVGKVAENVRTILREICKQNEVEILAGHVSKDHVHLFVSSPPYTSVSDKYANKGYAQMRTGTYNDTSGVLHTKLYLVWTQKGRAMLHDLLKPSLVTQ